jgi:hypothetical protein
MAGMGRSPDLDVRPGVTGRQQSGGSAMRALYLFLGEVLGHDRRREGAASPRASTTDEPLRPIRDGAFARWMAAGDRAVPRVAGAAAIRS